MPLTFNPGETKTFQLQAEAYHKRPRHWAGGKFIDCPGAGCALCAAGVRATESWALPISIGGVAEEWIFPQGVAQQLDVFTQQGYKLLGLLVKVGRTGKGVDTRYQVLMASESVAAAPPKPVAGFETLGATLTKLRTDQVAIDKDSYGTADRWAKLTSRLLMRKDFLDLIASEVQLMKDEGLWQ